MKRLILMAVMAMGCNYYGPDNPPPDPSPTPKYTIRRVDVADPNGLAVATCPAGSLIISGGGDCIACSPISTSAYLFGSGFTGSTGTPNSWVAGCYPGCAHAEAICLSSNIGGTFTQGLIAVEGGPEVGNLALWEAALAARGK